MTIVLPDELLQKTGFDEYTARIEFACWLFDRQRLDLWPAAQLAGLSRVEFEAQLRARKIPIYRYTEQDFAQDMATADQLGL